MRTIFLGLVLFGLAAAPAASQLYTTTTTQFATMCSGHADPAKCRSATDECRATLGPPGYQPRGLAPALYERLMSEYGARFKTYLEARGICGLKRCTPWTVARVIELLLIAALVAAPLASVGIFTLVQARRARPKLP